jgi:hypothetical protein
MEEMLHDWGYPILPRPELFSTTGKAQTHFDKAKRIFFWIWMNVLPPGNTSELS